jgi:hypothetical protein
MRFYAGGKEKARAFFGESGKKEEKRLQALPVQRRMTVFFA